MIRQISPDQLLQRYGVEHLKNASTLGALTEDALHYLLQHGVLLELDNGDKLFGLDDAAGCFYVILDGRIAFSKPGPGGMVHIRDYCFGMELGFVGMIGLHNRVGDTIAAESSVLLEVSCDLFSQLQLDMPNDFGVLLLNLSREMSRRLRDADDRLAGAE